MAMNFKYMYRQRHTPFFTCSKTLVMFEHSRLCLSGSARDVADAILALHRAAMRDLDLEP